MKVDRKQFDDALRIMGSEGKSWDAALEAQAVRGQRPRADEAFPGDRPAPFPGPVFGQADLDALKAASASTKSRAQTFDEGVAGRILEPAPRGGYAMPDAAVTGAVAPSGKPTDALAVRQFLAVGGTPEALADATAYSLRRPAMAPDGTLDPGKVHRWLSQNREALAEMPPGVAQRFRTAADAQSAVDGMVAQRKDQLGAVGIQDSPGWVFVIQAVDGQIRFDGRPMGEDGTALPGQSRRSWS